MRVYLPHTFVCGLLLLYFLASCGERRRLHKFCGSPVGAGRQLVQLQTRLAQSILE